MGSFKSTVKTMDTLLAATLGRIPTQLQNEQGLARNLASARTTRDEAATMRDGAIKLQTGADKFVDTIKKKGGLITKPWQSSLRLLS